MNQQSQDFKYFKQDGETISQSDEFVKLAQVKTVLELKEYLKQYRQQIKKERKEREGEQSAINMSHQKMISIMMKETVYGQVVEIKGGINVLLLELVKESESNRSHCVEQYTNMMIGWTQTQTTDSSQSISWLHRGLNMMIQTQIVIKQTVSKQIAKYLIHYLAEQLIVITKQMSYNQQVIDLLVDACRTIYYLLQRTDEMEDKQIEQLNNYVHSYYEISRWINKDLISQLSNIYVLVMHRFSKYSLEQSLKHITNEQEMVRLSQYKALCIIYKQLFAADLSDLSHNIILKYTLHIISTTNHPYTMYTAVKTLNTFIANCLIYLQTKQDNNKYGICWILEVFNVLLVKWEFPFKGLVVEFYESIAGMLQIADFQGQKVEVQNKMVQRCIQLGVSAMKRKYQILAVVTSDQDTQRLFTNNPSILQELMMTCSHKLSTYGLLYLSQLLTSHYQQNKDKDIIDTFNKTLIDILMTILDNNRIQVETRVNIIQKVIPLIVKAQPLLIGGLLKVTGKSGLRRLDDLLYTSVLRQGQQYGQVEMNDYAFKVGGITINQERLETLLCSADRDISGSMVEFISISQKSTVEPGQLTYSCLLMFLDKQSRTSSPEFRAQIVQTLRRFLHRLRVIYDNTLQGLGKNTHKSFNLCKWFIKALINQIFRNMHPSESFEQIAVELEVLRSVYQIFGVHPYEFKRNIVYKGVTVLKELDCYSQDKYEVLLTSLTMQYDSVRGLGYQTLLSFPSELPYVDREYLMRLFEQSLLQSGSAVISNYETASLLFSLIFCHYLPIYYEDRQSSTVSLQLRFLNELISVLEKKSALFSESFLVDWPLFYANMPHGICTALSALLIIYFEQKTDYQGSQKMIYRLMDILQKNMKYAVQISANNVNTSVFESNKTGKEIEKDSKDFKVDCRGHPILTNESKANFLQNMDRLLQGNTLIDTVEDQQDTDNENVMIVAFYLLTKENGLLFITINQIYVQQQGNEKDLIGIEDYKRLTMVFFEGLLQIKHLGSIDRIAKGIEKMCTSIHMSNNKELYTFSNTLLERILGCLAENGFPNILRRSGGLPYAVVSLLSTEPPNKKTNMLPKTLETLFKLSQQYKVIGKETENKQEDCTNNAVNSKNSANITISIHALNILKMIFQSQSIKKDAEIFIGQSFEIAIMGFSSSDWGIRNSSLMLFSALTKRTFGVSRENNRNTLNINEFFSRAPMLVPYFKQEIKHFIQQQSNMDKKGDDIQYPSLYPIALVLSKLQPNEGNNGQEVKVEQKFQQSDILEFYGLLVGCADHSNLMGRYMVAKSVIPFINVQAFWKTLVELLNHSQLTNNESVKANHNYAHGLLLQILQIVKEFQAHQSNQVNYTISQEERNHFNSFYSIFQDKLFIFTQNKCPLVQVLYVKILNILLQLDLIDNSEDNSKFLNNLNFILKQKIFDFIQLDRWIYDQDYGHSILMSKNIQIFFQIQEYQDRTTSDINELFSLSCKHYIKNSQHFTYENNDIFNLIIQKTIAIIKKQTDDEQNIKKALMILDILNTEQSKTNKFSHCLNSLIKMLYIIIDITKINKDEIEYHKKMQIFLDNLNKFEINFCLNSQIIKHIIMFIGIQIKSKLLQDSNDKLDSLIQFYISISQKYSNAEQKDFIRISLIKSFKKCLKFIYEKSIEQSDFNNILQLQKPISRLLQDEIPEIRQKMANLLQKMDTKRRQKQVFDYVIVNQMKYVYELIMKQEKNLELVLQFIPFLIQQIFVSEQFDYKFQNHQEKKIFSLDKPNKFLNDFMIKKLCYVLLHNILVSNQGIFELEDYKKLVEDYKMANEQQIKKYQEFINRDEYLYELISNLIYNEQIISLINKQQDMIQMEDINEIIYKQLSKYMIK